jgi:hypothetical protein
MLVCLLALAAFAATAQAVEPDRAPIRSQPAPDPYPGALPSRPAPTPPRAVATPATPSQAAPANPAPAPESGSTSTASPTSAFEVAPSTPPRRSAAPATTRAEPTPAPRARARAPRSTPAATTTARRTIPPARGQASSTEPGAPTGPIADGSADRPLMPAAIALAVLTLASLLLLLLVRRLRGRAPRRDPRPLYPLLLAALLAMAVPGALGDGRAEAAVPTVTPVCNGVANECAGWSIVPVALNWLVSPADADRSGCTPRVFDADGVHEQTCTASFPFPPASASVKVTILVDRTPPQGITAAFSRPPDPSGWYTSPVAVSFAGTDGTSGIASCASVVYAGPDSTTASAQGGCRDRAGNQSPPLAVPLRYDATPPALGIVPAQPGDGFSVIRWTASSDARLRVSRTPGLGRATKSVVFQGRTSAFVDRRVENGRAYRYEVQAVDQAGNVSTLPVVTRPGRRVLQPARGAHVSGTPLLRWTAVSRTRYYNVQLRRDGRKVMTAWPTRPMLQLKSDWQYAGKVQGLVPGFYRWDVWPGIGRREAGRFGSRIGTGTFIVDPPALAARAR